MGPSFETRSFGALLKMRSEGEPRPEERAIARVSKGEAGAD
jgi:hypothetical protein